MAGKKKYNKIIKNGEYSTLLVKYKDKILEVLIDNEDAEKVVAVGSWHAIYDKTLQIPSYYIAHRYNNKTRGKGVIKLHRFITNCPSDKVIDHINHNTLDNRKENLKICTHFENQQNLRSKKSEHTGVFNRKINKNGKQYSYWTASISKNNIRYTKDCKSYEDALKWRLQKEQELYGKEV